MVFVIPKIEVMVMQKNKKYANNCRNLKLGNILEMINIINENTNGKK
tara:strand:- start:606 stop:746 length:141 start_codon:yes stop_codon:yes gene_type:complete